MKKMKPSMNEGGLRFYSAKMQKHGNFQRHEKYLKHRCEKSGGFYAVTYKGPPETELGEETRVQRKRMHQKMNKHYCYQAMITWEFRSWSFFMERIALDLFDDLHKESFMMTAC